VSQLTDEKEALRKNLVACLTKIETADAYESARLAQEVHSLYLKFSALTRKDREDGKIDLLPKNSTIRTPERTKDVIIDQAVGLILVTRSRRKDVEYFIDERKLLFSIYTVGHSIYQLFLHNKFLTERFPPRYYYFVSNIEMTREEFLDFVEKIRERAIYVLEKWGQSSNLTRLEEI
jgi:hypothetical protein